MSPRRRAGATRPAAPHSPDLALPPLAARFRTARRLHIVSGGQTGVDRAALDLALELGIPCGGWCPRGRRAEDGPLAPRYPLTETPSRAYAQRTEWNVRDADATLVLARPPLGGGTALTVRLARRYGRPYLVVDPRDLDRVAEVVAWMHARSIRVLNVAGPRSSGDACADLEARDFLRRLLESLPRRD